MKQHGSTDICATELNVDAADRLLALPCAPTDAAGARMPGLDVIEAMVDHTLRTRFRGVLETYMTDALRRMEESFERRLAEMESTISRLSVQQACLVHSLPLALQPQPQHAALPPPRSLKLRAHQEQQPIDRTTSEAHDDSDDDDEAAAPRPAESEPAQEEETAFSTAFEEKDCAQGSPPTAIPVTVSDKLVLNVGGRVFHTLRSTLAMYPDTMLGAMFSSRNEGMVPRTHEYFFDRNGDLFASILDFYRTGELVRPVGVAEEAWLTELDYWNIPLPEEPEPIESVDAAEAAAREAARKVAATQAETNLTNRLAMVARNRPLFLERTFNRLVTELSSVLLEWGMACFEVRGRTTIARKNVMFITNNCAKSVLPARLAFPGSEKGLTMQEMEQRGVKVFRNNDMMGNLIKMQTAERAYVLGLLAERLWRERGIDVTFDDFRVSVSRGLSAAVNVSGSVEWPTTAP